MKIKKVSIILISFFFLLCLITGITIISVQAFANSRIQTDNYSFALTRVSNHGFDFDEYGPPKNQDVIYENNNIEISYNTKTDSKFGTNVYDKISALTVRTVSLPSWGGGWHRMDEGNLNIEIWKDGNRQEIISRTLWANSSVTIDMSYLNNKYSYYSFRVVYRYKIHWWTLVSFGDKYIRCVSPDFYVNTKDVSGYFSKTVLDVNNNTYTNSLINNGTYKTDNKAIKFLWNATKYDKISSNDNISVKGSICDSKGNPLSNYQDYSSGDKGFEFNNFEYGTYIIKLKTDIGKSFQVTLILEPYEPLLNIEPAVRKNDIYFIQLDSKITWTDTTSIDKDKGVQIKHTSKKIESGYTLKVGNDNIEWNKEYIIVVYKITGSTEEYKFVFTNSEQVDLNFNQNTLQKSPIARWYETLDTEEKVINSYVSYDNALQVAIEREWKNVTTDYYDGGTWTAGIGMDDPINKKKGNYYIYKSRKNPKEQNAYFSREALDSSILAYAKNSIKNYTYYDKKQPAEPASGEKIYKTIQEGDSEYNLFLLSSFSLLERPYVDLWINGEKQNFRNQITINEAGVYKIQEINPYDETVTYFIYIQNSAPNVEYVIKDTSLSQQLTDTNTRFGTFFDLILSEDLDTDSLLIIEKSGIGSVPKIYTYAELLAIMNQPKSDSNYLFNVSGKYTITAINHYTVYSKVLPTTYTFYVSVNPPYINEPIVNTDKNEFTFSFALPSGEYNTQITSVLIEKYVNEDKGLETLTVDSKGVKISPDNASYVFNTKGYYILTITDNFGRIITKEFAFSREKPAATLTIGNSEVIELQEDSTGYFNKKVAISWYDRNITAKMYYTSYTIVDGKVILNSISKDYVSGTSILEEGYYWIQLIDIDLNSLSYTFYIDRTAPTMKLFTKEIMNGVLSEVELKIGAFKNIDIFSTYTANNQYESPIKIYVEKDKHPISYPIDGIFTEEGFYEISIADMAGNSNEYSFTIDKTAPQGFLYLDDGSSFIQNGITNKNVYCTWSEDGVTATCNDAPYSKNSMISNNKNDTKIYRIVLTDKAGNKSVYVFQISKDIPIIVIKTESGKTIANNSSVDEAFIISWDDPNYTYKIEIIKDGKAQAYTNYTELSSKMFKFIDSGSYKFTFTAGNGNIYVYQVKAMMRPYATVVAGENNLNPYDYSNTEVKVTISDRNASIEVYKLDTNNSYKIYSNWSLVDSVFILTEDGTYRIIIKNDFDKMNTYYFTIKTSLPEATFTDTQGNIIDTTKEYIGNVLVSYNKDEVAEYKIYKNGQLYGNNKLSDIGRYTIILVDKAGNKNTYTLSIVASKSLNWAGIITIIILCLALIGLAIFLIIKFKRPFSLKK